METAGQPAVVGDYRQLLDKEVLRTFFENDNGFAIKPTRLSLDYGNVVVDGVTLDKPLGLAERVEYAELAFTIGCWIEDAWLMRVEAEPSNRSFYRRWRIACKEREVARQVFVALRRQRLIEDATRDRAEVAS